MYVTIKNNFSPNETSVYKIQFNLIIFNFHYHCFFHNIYYIKGGAK
jgi:hypothetical protein